MKLSSHPGSWYGDIVYQLYGTLVAFATVINKGCSRRMGHTMKTLVLLHIADPTFRP